LNAADASLPCPLQFQRGQVQVVGERALLKLLPLLTWLSVATALLEASFPLGE